ncbi:MopE-related protein [Polyangium sp. y55x31]|uniref:MopE-related protein n=1 Tax=Polyangium sp. y55x31 TaxID=3042688 RepID=UPI002482926D|nr:MopE-related protein [Polyangium sp. y55x31]MDI1482933.1 MopE-related protein [Polyangium sp. y55x31]
MRSTIPATLVALGCLAIHAFGCAGGTDETTGGGTAGAGTGGTGGMGGTGGQGGAGGATCMPTDEVCDGLDNDCDQDVDEDCPCVEGQTQSCYSGVAGTQGIGACTAGQQKCDLNGKWSKCVGEVVPKTQESCNGIDDDCNGSVDDMAPTTCGFGACQVTVVTCENGQLNQCTPLPPSLEVCDGLDNDCDQIPDDSFPEKGKACTSDKLGACAKGKYSCTNGALVCVPDVTPIPETCNGIDDDCDGTVDDSIPGTGGECGTGLLGVCANGAISCNGTSIDCFPVTPQSPEKCNGLDDDCDGVIDENNPEGGTACQTGQSAGCSAGTRKCTNGAIVCEPNASSTPEQCNGIDDNCNGVVDEGNPGGGVACACAGTTACSGGQLICTSATPIYLYEDFANAPGWTLGPEWEINTAIGGSCTNLSGTHNDPTNDTSSSSDNKIAGVVIGGCSTSSQSATTHGYYYLTSPAFNTSEAPGVILQFQRWLNSDVSPYMNNVIEVFNGTAWVQVWQSGSTASTASSWTKVSYDLSAYKNANMRIRWGFNIASSGIYPYASWNIDDVVVASTLCP